MIGIYLICFIAFPIAVFINAHKTYSVDRFLDKQDVDVIKGIATCFVVLGHLNQQLKTMNGYNQLLDIFSTTGGGMGVLLFFFLSGYGLYNGYRGKEVDIIFWKKRLMNVFFPCIIIQLIFYFIEVYRSQTFNFKNMIFKILFGAGFWFIDVILIQYFIFFVTWKLAKKKLSMWILLNFLCSMIVAGVFIKCDLNARWYNGLMLFPFGMLIAYKEEEIIALLERKWNIFFTMTTTLFVISGVTHISLIRKNAEIDMLKTFSGICLSMLVCLVFLRIKLCSKIMSYIGARSLFFYLIHGNILYLFIKENINGLSIFYLVLILTFPLVEFFYRFHFWIKDKLQL